MRLRAGILVGMVPFILVLLALPSTMYAVHTVGPDFRTVGPDGPDADDETRQLDGQWTMTSFRLYNETWETRNENPSNQWTTTSMADDRATSNGKVADLHGDLLLATVAGIAALCLGAVGAWNVAMRDRFRWFTAASFFLAALLFLGGTYVYAFGLPGALHEDAQTGDDQAFGVIFEHYIDPEGGEPGYYFEFEGSYPNTDPGLGEQLEYGPGGGFWLLGAAGVTALVAAAVLLGAPSLEEERGGRVQVREVVRYVPVPSVDGSKRRRRYPKRMPAVSRRSPGLKDGKRR